MQPLLSGNGQANGVELGCIREESRRGTVLAPSPCVHRWQHPAADNLTQEYIFFDMHGMLTAIHLADIEAPFLQCRTGCWQG